MSASVSARGLGVRFLFDRQQRLVSPMLARLRRRGATVWGLRHVDIEIGPGEGVALIGATGSGKTSLLRAIAGILPPDEGQIEVVGRVGSLLSTGAGLLTVLTGRENSRLLGVLSGLSPRETRAALEGIKGRSSLEDAFERPVSSYSQGMRARLGFAVAEQRHTDMLLLDEVHEALDHEFRAIVHERADRLRAAGGIVVAAGHDHLALEPMCDRALLLSHGTIVDDGSFSEVVDRYVAPVEGAAASAPTARG